MYWKYYVSNAHGRQMDIYSLEAVKIKKKSYI